MRPEAITQGGYYIAASGFASRFNQDLQYREPVLALREKAALLKKAKGGFESVLIDALACLGMIQKSFEHSLRRVFK
jgi:hypothetical protein